VGTTLACLVWATTAWGQNAPPEPTPAPAPTPAPTPAPAPAETSTKLHWSAPIIEAGGAVFTTLYIASSLAAADGYNSPDGTSNPRKWLWYPGVGPFVMLKDKYSAVDDVLFVLDGLGQLGGIATFVYGIVTPTRVPAEPAPKAARFDVAPLVGPGVSGAAVVGSF
jgi:hypothetical protein